MLAPPEKAQLPSAPEPQVKRRTITLTDRAPVVINEDEWETIAEGKNCYEWGCDTNDGWEIAIRVRRERQRFTEWNGKQIALPYFPTWIVHAKYGYTNEGKDEYQTVRVGRVLHSHLADHALWKNMCEVADELRERINRVNLRREVTHALDRCFANLKPQRA